MKIDWDVTENDIKKITDFYTKHKRSPFVLDRMKRNLNRENIIINKEIFWQFMISCLLATQQKSGPNSAVSKFMREKPFPLSLSICRKQKNVSSYVGKILSKRKGIRFSTKIGNEITYNLQKLAVTGWDIIDDIHAYYNSKEDAEYERVLAEKIDNLLKGFGPKQSRNLLQSLGVSRYEIPIDSRIIKWLNYFEFPIKLSANALTDKNYYNFIMDGIIILCKKAAIPPCVLDAVIFSNYDSDWSKTATASISMR